MNLSEAWAKAIKHDKIALRTDDRKLLRQQLYACRPEGAGEFVIAFPEKPEDEVWIIRKGNPDAKDR